MAETKKPTGLKITRDKNKFVLEWKKGDSDYGQGQQFQYKLDQVGSSDSWKPSPADKLGANKTSAKVTVDLSKYYPNSGKPKLAKVCMRVRGNRKKYTKNGKTVNPDWSDWASKEFDIKVPNKPTLTAELDENLSNKTLFSWSTSTSDSAAAYFSNVKWDAILIKDCTESSGAKINFNASDSTYQSGTGTASGSIAITEDSATLATGSYTRWFRICARGPQGDSAYVYAKHVYAKTERANVETDPSATDNDANGMDVVIDWEAPSDPSKPIDQTTVQYCITVPAAGVTCPAGATWTDANVSADTKGKDAAAFTVDAALNTDECLFVRVNTKHDDNTTYGVAKLAKTGFLSDPTNLSVATDNVTHKATVTATNNSTVPDSKLAVLYRDGSRDIIIGIIAHNQSIVTVQGPDWSGEDAIAFGVMAVVGSYTKITRPDGADSYEGSYQMRSANELWDGGAVPKAPTGVKADATDKKGTIAVQWSWPWNAANGAEISWSDHDDAWESTDEPDSYEIPFLKASKWYISGLDTGKTWYVRVRLFIKSGDEYTFGPWSDIVSVDLAEVPSVPVLVLASGVITPDGSVNAYWAYSAEDGTTQLYAEVADATYSSGSWHYDNVIAHVAGAQSIELKAEELGWTAGSTHYLAIRVMSSAGKFSDSWSNLVAVKVAPALSCSISSTSLVDETLSIEGESISVKALKALPLSVTVAGADKECTTEVAIERASDYRVMRPNERNFDGFADETIASVTIEGAGTVSIDVGDLMGSLDDGADYRIVATVRDNLGRSKSVEMPFVVDWTHQALMPEGSIYVDNANYAAMITPEAPAGALSTDRVDIYRLSNGYPELIFPDAEFGKTYVDPYPAIGELGGHRIVFKTAAGDYITADKRMAWKDFYDEDNDRLDIPVNVIDFNGIRVEIEYDIDLSDKFEKDYAETVYLDGSIEGNYGKAVKRKTDINAAVITDDVELIQELSRLCDYSGPMHIRTKDGSSYWANVDVQRNMAADTAHKLTKFTFNVKRHGARDYDAVLLEDWK